MKRIFAFFGVLLSALLFHSTAKACNGPVVCAFKTYKGYYLTAVGGGGRTTDVIHSDAKKIQNWERFTLEDTCSGDPVITYAIKTYSGHYLTAVGGGGRITDVIHSDATQVQAWEKFKLLSQGGGIYAIQTVNGRFLTAISGGGRITDVIHSDAKRIGSWEKFEIVCE